jgi:hypothetical protein
VVPFAAEVRNFASVRTGSENYGAFYSMGTGGSFATVKAAGA